MLEESGLLHEEPAKLFPDLQMTAQTKTRTPKSSSSSQNKTRTSFVRDSKQVLSATSSGTSSSNQTQFNRRSSDAKEVLYL